MAGESFSTHSVEELEAELRAIEEEETRRKGEGGTPDPSEPKDSSKPEDPSEPEDSPAPDELPKESSEDEASREQPRERIKKLGNIAIRANLSRDRDALAKRYAGEALDNKVYSKNKIANAIMGFAGKNLFRLASERKMMREIREGKDFTLKNGETTNINKLIESDAAAIIERFQHGIYDEEEVPGSTSLYIHRRIGNDREKNNLGESYKENAWASANIRSAIDSFLKSDDNIASIKSGNYSDLKAAFDKHMEDFRESSHRDAKSSKVPDLMYDNYADIAWNAMLAGQSEKDADAAIKKINEAADDIRVYDANVYNGARSEKHHALIDKACEALDARGFTLGADVLAIAGGVAAFMSRTATGKIARHLRVLGLPASIATGTLATARAYARTRNQYNIDRSDMLYNTEVGDVDYSEAKLSKREKKISGTIYEMRSATSLINAIEKASQSEDLKVLQEATKEARARIIISDQDRKPLISFTKGKVGDERLKLDIAVIEAEKKLKDTLSKEEFEKYESIRDKVATNLLSIARENDEDFYKKRNRAAAGRAVMTAGLSVATYLGLQAIKDYRQVKTTSVSFEKTIRASDEAEFEKYSKDPRYIVDYLRSENIDSGPSVEHSSELPENSPLKSMVSYLGWANNGTKAADGNELRVFLQNGKLISDMHGASTINGKVLDYDALLESGNIKGFITLGNAKFEVVPNMANGQLSWGDGGVFTIKGPDNTESTIEAIGKNGEKLYKYFEVAYVENPNAAANEAKRIIPFATDVGRNLFSGTIDADIPTGGSDSVPDAIYAVKKITESTRTVSESRNFGQLLTPVLTPVLNSIIDRFTMRRTRVPSSPNAQPESQEPSSETPEAASSSFEDIAPTATIEGTTSSSETTETAGLDNSSSEASESTSDSETPESPSAPEESADAIEARRVEAREGLSEFLNSLDAEAFTYGDAILRGAFDNDSSILDLIAADWWRGLDETQQARLRDLMRNLEGTGDLYGRSFRDWLATHDAEA